MNQQNYYGCDELRTWLVGQGFKIENDFFAKDSRGCNWHAYKRTENANDCECNDKPPAVCVKPFFSQHPIHFGADVEVAGKAGGIFYKLEAYSLNVDTLKSRLIDIEKSLIAAWNALNIKPTE
jgi:hypothetical protein